MICIRYRITGRVQGVFYRGSTQSQAQALGITGNARNLSSGQVEVIAYGEEAQLEQLKVWLWQGPRLAEVTDIQSERIEMDSAPSTFTTN